MARTYTPPTDIDLSQVITLLPAHKQKQELSPETPVFCINRGPFELRDMHNADPYVVPPSAVFQVSYATAQHLQKRLIVPGTRNPNPYDASVPQFVSWIGIRGVDPDDQCVPFDEDFLDRYAGKSEGLNREGLSPVDRDVQIRRTGDLARGLPGLGLAPSGGIAKPQQQVIGSDNAVAAALAPVEGSDAKAEFARNEAAGWEKPQEADLTVHSAPTPDEIRRTSRRR
jgi:hypothetical protein